LRIAFAALGRDDQAAWRVDGGGGENPFPVGVDVVNRTLTRVRGGRALSRTDVAASPRGTRGQRSRPGWPAREPARRERRGAGPAHGSLAGRCEVCGRSVLAGQAVLARAELPTRHRLSGRNARTELTRLGELSRWGERIGSGECTGRSERPRRGKLSRGHRSAVLHPWTGRELSRR
jgi:hypothetical protein